MSIIAQQLGRTVYYMLKRREAFNPDKFYGNKKIENKDSSGEHIAYVASRRLHEKKLFKSPLLRLAHTSLRAVCMRRNYLSRRSRGLRITEAYTAGLLKNENYMRLRPPLILSVRRHRMMTILFRVYYKP